MNSSVVAPSNAIKLTTDVAKRIFRWMQFNEKSIAVTDNAIAIRSKVGNNVKPDVVHRLKNGSVQVLGADLHERELDTAASVVLSQWMMRGADRATILRFMRRVMAK